MSETYIYADWTGRHWYNAWLQETLRKRRFKEWLIARTGQDLDAEFRRHEDALQRSEIARRQMPEGI